MNLILFSLFFILFTFNVPYQAGETTQIIDVLPDFIGYLILWLLLEKRRVNRRMNGVYTAVSVMTLLSFLFFVGQLRYLFADFLNGDGRFLKWLFTGLEYVFNNYNDLILLAAVLILAWFFFALLGYWEKKEEYKGQRAVCKIAIIGCGLVGLLHIGASLIILPFSWHWLSYPLSLLLIVAAWYSMKDSSEMEAGIRN